MATLAELKQTLSALGLSDDAIVAAIKGVAKEDSDIKESFDAERKAAHAQAQAEREAAAAQENAAIEEWAGKLAGKLKPIEGLRITHRVSILFGPVSEMKVVVSHGKAQVTKGDGTREYHEPKNQDKELLTDTQQRVYENRLSLGLTLMADGTVASIGGDGGYSTNCYFTPSGTVKTQQGVAESAPRWFAGLCQKIQQINGKVSPAGLTHVSGINGEYWEKKVEGKVVETFTADQLTCISKSDYSDDNLRQFNDWLDSFLSR